MMRKAGVAIFLVFCALQVRAEFVPVRIEDMPRLLSETRVFQDLQSLRINSAFMPYELNVSFWSDGAHKQRWMYLPGKIEYSATNEWKFPSGTVFVKHFEIGTQRRRLETRLLVRDGTGGVCGVSYKWREKGDDADLVRDRIQTERWQFPGPADCIVCHNAGAGGVLGLNARQINCGNQLRRWNEAGLFHLRLTDEELGNAPKLVRVNDANASIKCRARAYLDVNCAFCHRPGAPGNFDARWPT